MKGKRIIWLLLFCLCLGGAGYYGYHAVIELREYKTGEDTYRNLRQYVSFRSGTDQGEQDAGREGPEKEQNLPGERMTKPPQVNFKELSRINSQIVGWIYGADGAISYPVVQGKDNEYYLNHLFNGQTNSSGSIFMDTRCESDFSGFHTILYGHHMKNGSMFGSLNQYNSQSYYESHPEFLLILPDRTLELELFSAYVADVEQPAWKLNFSSIEERTQWLSGLKERSAVNCPVEPGPQDQIVTLSTCSYEFENARFVVHGVVRMTD